MELLQNIASLLPELLLTAVIAFQAFLFRQVSEARREHLELRVEIAQNYLSIPAFERALDKLEQRFIDHLKTHLNIHRSHTP
ncbi:TPA: hypothetical protein L4Q83_000859 [Pseudomonas aeruginosa]|nr:hypothetical protein [Pseudomonas sp. P818]HBO2948542.1 hypothetical protein [Pseudomonas aeruginosa]